MALVEVANDLAMLFEDLQPLAPPRVILQVDLVGQGNEGDIGDPLGTTQILEVGGLET